MRKILFLVFVCVFMMTSVSALTIVNESSIEVNKTIGVDTTFKFTILNDEDVSFYNITFETNDFVSMTTIPELESGTSIEVIGIIYKDIERIEDIKIIGSYFTNIGKNFVIHPVDISQDGDIDVCDMTIYESDIISWHNSDISKSIKIWNAASNTVEATIVADTLIQKSFSTPTVFSYYITKYLDTNRITGICDITVLPSTGYVIDPLKNTKVNLKVNINYPETSLKVDILQSEYELDVGATSEGIWLVTNIGGNLAKDVNISGEWFLDIPVFDLSPGSSKTVAYTISPKITNTSETNKTYIKSVIFSGNFPVISRDLSIFVRYGIIDTSAEDLLTALTVGDIFAACLKSPEHPMCQVRTEYIYRNLNASDTEFNVSMTVQQFWDYMSFGLEDARQKDDRLDNLTGTIIDLNNQVEAINGTIHLTHEESVKASESTSETNDLMLVTVFVIIMIVFIIIIVSIILYKKKIAKYENLKFKGNIKHDN